MANGELLSGAVATTGLAVSVIGLDRSRFGRWMFAAGLLAGLALSLKQSGFDGLVAMLLWLAIRAATESDQRPRSLRAAIAARCRRHNRHRRPAGARRLDRVATVVVGDRRLPVEHVQPVEPSELVHAGTHGSVRSGGPRPCAACSGVAGLAERAVRRFPRSLLPRASRRLASGALAGRCLVRVHDRRRVLASLLAVADRPDQRARRSGGRQDATVRGHRRRHGGRSGAPRQRLGLRRQSEQDHVACGIRPPGGGRRARRRLVSRQPTRRQTSCT